MCSEYTQFKEVPGSCICLLKFLSAFFHCGTINLERRELMQMNRKWRWVCKSWFVMIWSPHLQDLLDLSNLATCQIVWMIQQFRRPRRVQCHCDSVVYNADHLPFGEGINCNRYFKILQTQKSVAEWILWQERQEIRSSVCFLMQFRDDVYLVYLSCHLSYLQW